MLSEKDLLNYQKLAFKNATSNSLGMFIETCYRYVSKTYHTPLHVVKEIYSIPEVILMKLEDQYKELDPQDLESIKEQLLSKEKNRPVFSSGFEESDDDMEASDEIWLAEQAKIANEKDKQMDADKIKKATEEALRKFNKSIDDFKKTTGIEEK
jgi:cytochrome c556